MYTNTVSCTHNFTHTHMHTYHLTSVISLAFSQLVWLCRRSQTSWWPWTLATSYGVTSFWEQSKRRQYSRVGWVPVSLQCTSDHLTLSLSSTLAPPSISSMATSRFASLAAKKRALHPVVCTHTTSSNTWSTHEANNTKPCLWCLGQLFHPARSLQH